MNTPTIELLDIHKSFGATPVLEGVSLQLFPGEVHSLMGENGAGKSTLVKIMAGLHQPDKGVLRIEGREAAFHSTAQAQHAGVAVIYQEPTLFPDLSIAENIFMGRQPTLRWRRIDYAAMNREVSQQLSQLGVSLRPEDPVLGLSIADQQIVEIIKALTFDARVLIMDEPTAALSAEEVRRLFQVVARLRSKGVALMFVSHRLKRSSRSRKESRSCGMDASSPLPLRWSSLRMMSSERWSAARSMRSIRKRTSNPVKSF